jgi:hypothetical protein
METFTGLRKLTAGSLSVVIGETLSVATPNEGRQCTTKCNLKYEHKKEAADRARRLLTVLQQAGHKKAADRARRLLPVLPHAGHK